jgi:hypothetical protein
VRREGTEYYGRREDEASKTTWEKKSAQPPPMPPPLAIILILLLPLPRIAACRSVVEGEVVCRWGGPCQRVEAWTLTAEVRASRVKGEGDRASRRSTGAMDHAGSMTLPSCTHWLERRSAVISKRSSCG